MNAGGHRRHEELIGEDDDHEHEQEPIEAPKGRRLERGAKVENVKRRASDEENRDKKTAERIGHKVYERREKEAKRQRKEDGGDDVEGRVFAANGADERNER